MSSNLKSKVFACTALMAVILGLVPCLVSAKTNYLHNFLRDESQFRSVEQVTKILDENPSWVDEPDDRGYTPLYIAVERKMDKITSLLLDRGADVNKACLRAVKARDLIVVDYMISHGADVANADICSSINSEFVRAIRHRDWRVADYMISHGADVLRVDSKGNSYLHLAVNRNLVAAGKDTVCSTIRFLINKGISANCVNAKGQTPMHTLILASKDEMFHDGKRIYGTEPFLFLDCTYYGYAELVDALELLLNNGAEINRKDNDGHTPLHYIHDRGPIRTGRSIARYVGVWMYDHGAVDDSSGCIIM